ncbi:MAG: hypothetical protein HKN16_02170 [Saprospiraceae bacterium]|nr:hypothetical protein [Saprospiraceae bacterium]
MKGTTVSHSNIPYGAMKLSSAVKDYFVCLDCGNCEVYVRLTPKFLKWAEKQWEKSDRRGDDYV